LGKELLANLNEFVFCMLGTIPIIVLLPLLLGSVPAWPYNRRMGYYPSGGLGALLLTVIDLVLLRAI
jgi:Protein of unknown function (DUF3309)